MTLEEEVQALKDISNFHTPKLDNAERMITFYTCDPQVSDGIIYAGYQGRVALSRKYFDAAGYKTGGIYTGEAPASDFSGIDKYESAVLNRLGIRVKPIAGNSNKDIPATADPNDLQAIHLAQKPKAAPTYSVYNNVSSTTATYTWAISTSSTTI